MSKVQKAEHEARTLHANMLRKDGVTPYIVHPQAVVEVLQKYTDDENILCAGWLHDTLEDVAGYTSEKLTRAFGHHVAMIVLEVSEKKDPTDSREKSKATWRRRKEEYIQALEKNSAEALMVSCADKIVNLKSLVKWHTKDGDAIWKQFNAPEPVPGSEKWYYREVLFVLQSRLQSGIVNEYSKIVSTAEKKF